MKELKDALLENGYSGKEELQETEILNEGLSFTKLRDKLYSLGDIFLPISSSSFALYVGKYCAMILIKVLFLISVKENYLLVAWSNIG